MSGTKHVPFIDGDLAQGNRVAAEWLNDVNVGVYTAIGDGTNPPTTNAQVGTNVLGSKSDGQILIADSTNARLVAWAYPATAIAYGREFAATIGVAAAGTANFTANQLIVGNGASARMKLSGVSVTPNLAVSGINGLDTGVEAPSTWYYLYVVAKADGTAGAVWSLGTSGPTLPATYTFFALVGAGYNDSGSNLVPMYQRGMRFFYKDRQNVLLDGAATASAAITITAVVPPFASMFHGAIRYFGATSDGAGALTTTALLEVVNGSILTTLQTKITGLGLSAAQTQPGCTFDAPNISQTLRYYSSLVAGTAPVVTVDILGFTLPGGGQ